VSFLTLNLSDSLKMNTRNFNDFSSFQREIFKTIFENNLNPKIVYEESLKTSHKLHRRTPANSLSRCIQNSKTSENLMFSPIYHVKKNNLERIIRRIKGDSRFNSKNSKVTKIKKPVKRLSSEKRPRGRPRKYPIKSKREEGQYNE
jgi:hypothetical protein